MQPGPASDAGIPPAQHARPAGRRRWRRSVAVLILVLALAGLGVATRGALTQVMPRQFTAAQQRQIQAWEIGRRWRTLPETAIFPAALSYQLPAQTLNPSQTPGGAAGLALTARRLGIGPAASCAQGTDAAADRILAAYGCTTILRATYADSTGSMLVTVGVAVLPSRAAATAAGNRLASPQAQDPHGAVSPAAVPGTLAAGFSGSQRQAAWATHAGSYVIMTAAGYADGRPPERVAADPYLFAEMSNLEQGLGDAVSGVLGKVPPVPTCPGAPGC
jgi:hypothetical protein